MSKSNFTKFRCVTALILAVIMLSGTFAGCSKKDENEDEYSVVTSVVEKTIYEDEDGETTETGDGKTTETGSDKSGSKPTSSSSEEVDKAKTKGKTFTIMSALLPDKESNDNFLFEQLFFKRVREVEKEYGCTIKIVNTMIPTAANLAPLVQAGKQVANVIEVELRDVPAMVAAGYIIPWTNVPGININDSKYTASYTKIASYSGKCYGLQYMKPPELRYCVVMNKNLLKAANIDPDNIYTLIKQKKWNFDTLLDYARKTTNGKTYGVGGNPEYFMEMILAANDAHIVTMNNGKATPTYSSNKVIESLEFMNKLVNVDKVYLTNSQMRNVDTYISGQPNYIDQFVKGNLTFLFEDSWVLNQQIRPKVKTFDYGMISVPMGPSASNYSNPAGHARVFAVTSTNKELEFTSKIFNALAEQPSGYSGNDWWKDEIQMDYFQSSDKKSLDVYLDSLNNLSFDPGVGMESVFDTFMRSSMCEPIFWGGNSVSSSVKSIEGTLDSSINNLFNK